MNAYENIRMYYCLYVCMYICRTRPTFCVFLFWYRFQNKTTHFPRCRRNLIFAPFLVLFAVFLFAPQLHFAASAAHFVYTILFIYLPLLVNFILHLARALTLSHRHSNVCMHVPTYICMYKLEYMCRRTHLWFLGIYSLKHFFSWLCLWNFLYYDFYFLKIYTFLYTCVYIYLIVL